MLKVSLSTIDLNLKYCDLILKLVNKEVRLQLIYCYEMTVINDHIKRKSIYYQGKYRNY